MNQSVRRTRILWSIGAIVLVAFFGFENVSSSLTYRSINHGNIHTIPSYTYPGPSHDFTSTPHPWNLWADEVGTDGWKATSGRAHSDSTTGVTK